MSKNFNFNGRTLQSEDSCIHLNGIFSLENLKYLENKWEL